MATQAQPGSGAGGAVFALNANVIATYSTFSGDFVTNGDTSSGNGSEVYLYANNGEGPFKATLIDDILGQSGGSTVNDFVNAAYPRHRIQPDGQPV